MTAKKPSKKTPTKKTKKKPPPMVVLMVKPKRRARYWPVDGKGKTAWASIRVGLIGPGMLAIVGYMVGKQDDCAIPKLAVKTVEAAWLDEHSERKWEFAAEPV